MNEGPVSGQATFEASPGLVSRIVGDETVLVDLDAELYYSLDPIGSMAWSWLTTGYTIDGVAEELVQSFDVELGVAQADIEELVAELIDAGLLLAR
ncbi:MAG: PqqD family protein [Acidimicrobiales bacterium]